MTISYEASLAIIFSSCGVGFLWALFNLYNVLKVDLQKSDEEEGLNTKVNGENKDKIDTILDIGKKISDGAKSFLHAEYKYCAIVLVVMAIILYFAVDGTSAAKWRPYSAISFLVGGTTSIACGYAAMMIAVSANYRTSFSA